MSKDVELDVVWNGTMDKVGECPSLVPDRITKPGDFWTQPKRVYNKKSDYWIVRKGVDKGSADEENDVFIVLEDEDEVQETPEVQGEEEA